MTAPESAEVVAEAPTDARTGDLLALTDFGTVDFTSCAFDGQPISAFAWNCIDMVSEKAPLGYDLRLGQRRRKLLGEPAGDRRCHAAHNDVTGADARWHNTAVTMTFKAVDNVGASGVAYTQFQSRALISCPSLAISAP